ncbi:cation:dicarboxylase symporter family transporter [Bradyrhizobium lupini]|uniref:cation:dicarboxylate symporter family transporter n=1 Tax=Rhizobium lupini TaxID=136996 RepID=UPI0034C5D130
MPVQGVGSRPAIAKGNRLLGQILRIVTHPATIIAGVFSGLLFGFYLPRPAHALVPFAKLYVALLSMSMLPILVTALTWGIGQMLRNATTRALFPRMTLSYLLLLLIPSASAVVVCIGLSPGESLGEGAAAALGQQFASEPAMVSGGPIMAFLQGMVPSNIFAALSGAQFISIAFFLRSTRTGPRRHRVPRCWRDTADPKRPQRGICDHLPLGADPAAARPLRPRRGSCGGGRSGVAGCARLCT